MIDRWPAAKNIMKYGLKQFKKNFPNDEACLKFALGNYLWNIGFIFSFPIVIGIFLTFFYKKE
jgi:hypothetical protein